MEERQEGDVARQARRDLVGSPGLASCDDLLRRYLAAAAYHYRDDGAKTNPATAVKNTPTR